MLKSDCNPSYILLAELKFTNCKLLKKFNYCAGSNVCKNGYNYLYELGHTLGV